MIGRETESNVRFTFVGAEDPAAQIIAIGEIFMPRANTPANSRLVSVVEARLDAFLGQERIPGLNPVVHR
jgi:hypothetical protein